MNKMFRVHFYLRSNYTNVDGKTPILIRLYLQKERIYVCSTSLSVDPKKWDSSLCRMKSRNNEAIALNSELDRIEADLVHLFRKYEFSDNLSLDLIKAEYLGDSNTSNSFLGFFEDFIKLIKEEVGVSRGYASYQKYNALKKHFATYLNKDLHRKDLLMGELSYKVISGFEHYLLTDVGCQHNTVMHMLRNIKTVTRRAIKLGLLTKDPFANYKIRYKKTERDFLVEEEIQAIIDKVFSAQRLELVRDIFIFSCFTGLAYIDVASLTEENIVTFNGRKWIMTKRHKTAVPTNIILLDIPERIIEKYRGKDTKGRLLPILSNQKMNGYLKEIADLCGINKNLTFHVARHTFATLAITKGVSIESVSKMLGHTNINTTQIYARIINRKIESDMLNLAQNLNIKASI